MRLQRILLLSLVGGCGLSLALQTATAADTQPPTPPTSVVLYSFSPTILKAQWTAATDDVGVSGYRLDVATDPSFSAPVAAYTNKDVGTVTTLRLLGLSPATTYYLRVRAYDAAGHTSSNSATGDGRTRSLPAYPVADFVKMGWAHWSHASGDCVAPLNCGTLDDPIDDSNDFDNNFGEHNGSLTSNLHYRSDPDYFILNANGDNAQFDLATPTAGNYNLSMQIGPCGNCQVTISSCPGSRCPGGAWTQINQVYNPASGLAEKYSVSPITIPQGQTVTRFRVTAVNTTRVRGAVLKPATISPFTQLPPVGVHPRLAVDAAGLATIKLRAAVPGSVTNYLLTWLFAQVDAQGTFGFPAYVTSNSTHDIARNLFLTSLAAALTDANDPKHTARVNKAISALDTVYAYANPTTPTAYDSRAGTCLGGANAGLSCQVNADCPQSSQAPYGDARCAVCSQTQEYGCAWAGIDNAGRGGETAQDRSNVVSGFAVAYDLMFNDLDTTRRTNFATRLSQEADWLDSMARVGGLFTADSRQNNGRVWYNNGTGYTGLVLDNNLIAQELINMMMDQDLIHLDTMYDLLGGYGETAGYYSEATSRFTVFADGLNRAGTFNLFAYHNGVLGSSSRWMLDMMVGNAAFQSPMGDTGHDKMRASTLATLIGKYRDGLLSWMFNYVYPPPYSTSLASVVADYHEYPVFQALLYYDSSVAPVSPVSVLPLTQLYDVPMAATTGQRGGNSGYWFVRTSWDHKDALYLSTQCGDDQNFHGHADHGSLFFSGYNQIFLDDFGKIGDYGSASALWHYSETGHNAVMIDGKGEGHDQSILVNLCTATGIAPSFLSLASMDSTSAYGYQSYNPVQSARRHALFVNTGTDRGYVVTMDDVTKDTTPHDYKIRYLGCDSTSTGSWCPSAGAVTWSTVAPNHLLETGANANLDVFIAEPPVTTITTGNQYGANYVDLDSTQTRGMYVNLLFPTSTRLGVTLPPVTTIRTAGASGFQLNGDTILFNRVGGLQSDANVQSDGEILFVRGSASAQAFLATKATRLTYQGIQYLSAPQAPTAVAVEYTPAGLTAQLDMGSASSLTLALAAAPAQVTFNGQAVPFTYAVGQLTVTNLLGRGTLTTGTTGAIPGDLNGNSIVDILDLQRMVNVLLGLETDQAVIGRADLDGQNGATVLDLQRLVNLLLGV